MNDDAALYEADKLAHEEAVQNGGVCRAQHFVSHLHGSSALVTSQLILYWYGIPNPVTGMNLATCIWQSRKHAIAASSHPRHIQAMRLAAGAYEVYSLERYKITKAKGEANITVETYTGGEVGW